MKLCRIAVVLLGLCLHVPPAGAAAPGGGWTLGVLAYRGAQTSERQWGPTAAYLSEHLAVPVRLQTCTLDEMAAGLATGELDFVLTNPGHYVELEYRHGISRIATLKKLRQGSPYTVFGAVIFTRADRDDIHSLADLTGKRFAGVDEAAFGGFQMAWRELKAAGVDPFSDLASLEFMGFPQDDIVRRVQSGTLDAGTVRTGILEQMASEGLITLDEFRILNPLRSPDYPFRHSTRLYPEWAFAKASATPERIAREVAVALLQLSREHPAARAGHYAGWTVPLDYAPVHELFRELEIGPYQRPPVQLLKRLLQQYWHYFALAGLVIIFGLFHVIQVERLVVQRTRELTTSKRELESEIAERERMAQQTRTLLQEKRFLARKCMAVQEDERRHLARELHDELGQCITAIQADAETIQELSHGRDARLSASAHAIQEVAVRIYGVVHNLMERLRPSALDHLGLADTLREEIRNWQARCPDIHYQLNLDGELEQLGEQLNISLYRIIQESLTNIAKYAQARRVAVNVRLTGAKGDGVVMLEVIDDGIGMDPAAAGRGLGLIGMRERVEALGGKFSFESAPGAGLRLRASLPARSETLTAAAAS